MQSILSRNWTRIAVSISCDDNHYTTGTSCYVREMGGEIYTHRENFFFPYLLPGAKGMSTLALPCKLVRDTSNRLRVPCSTLDSLPLSKSDRVVLITWSPSGYTPVVPDCPDVQSYPCLLISAWQRVKGHGVTRNEPKIHVIYYITQIAPLH